MASAPPINTAGTSDDIWASVGELQVADDCNIPVMTELSESLSIRDESERVALNIIKRIDATSAVVNENVIMGDGADSLNALANALAVLSDIAKYR